MIAAAGKDTTRSRLFFSNCSRYALLGPFRWTRPNVGKGEHKHQRTFLSVRLIIVLDPKLPRRRSFDLSAGRRRRNEYNDQ